LQDLGYFCGAWWAIFLGFVGSGCHALSMNAPAIAVVISTVSLLISTTAYFNPRKAGGAVQWEIVPVESHNRGCLRHVGSSPARKLKVTIKSALPSSPIEKDISHPNDLIYFPILRVWGNSDVVVTVEWKRLWVITKRRIFDI